VLDNPAQQARLFASLDPAASQPDLVIESRAEPGGQDAAVPAIAAAAQQPAHEGAADDAAQAVET
jgi:hypothetical protein